LRQNDRAAFGHAADLFGQVVKARWPSQQEAQKTQVLPRHLWILIATDSARQALSRGDFHSAANFAGAGSTEKVATRLSPREINQSEQNNFAQLEISH